MAKKVKIEEDHSTEDKIKAAARKVFTKKGFAATRTRDIAEEAGINLALLNYYFRSKEKLFEIVMGENMAQFILGMKGVLYNEKKTLIEKVEDIVDNYIELLKAHPDLPLFILSEIRANPERLAAKMDVKNILFQSPFFKQIMEETKGRVNPLHFFMNILGLTIFPFIASPLLKNVGNLKQADFDAMMQERKKMIPAWIRAMLKVK
jgi:AcrR family transcriptional regulator